MTQHDVTREQLLDLDRVAREVARLAPGSDQVTKRPTSELAAQWTRLVDAIIRMHDGALAARAAKLGRELGPRNDAALIEARLLALAVDVARAAEERGAV